MDFFNWHYWKNSKRLLNKGASPNIFGNSHRLAERILGQLCPRYTYILPSRAAQSAGEIGGQSSGRSNANGRTAHTGRNEASGLRTKNGKSAKGRHFNRI